MRSAEVGSDRLRRYEERERAEMIYSQSQTDVKDIPFGLLKTERNGCGWIAVYNVLEILGVHPGMNHVKKSCEKHLPIGGIFGMPKKRFIKSLSDLGVKTETAKSFSEIKKAPCAVIWYAKKSGKAHYIVCQYLPDKDIFRYFNPTFPSMPPAEMLKTAGAAASMTIIIKGA